MLITLARKPLVGSVVQNVLAHGVGVLNIDQCRIAGTAPSVPMGEWTQSGTTGATGKRNGEMSKPHPAGRWPANVLHDGSDAVLMGFPVTISVTRNTATCTPNGKGMFAGGSYEGNTYSDTGSAARFFKQVKGC